MISRPTCLIGLILICWVMYSCQGLEEPVLQSFTPVSIEKIDKSEVILHGQISYLNSNPIGGRLESVFLTIYANDVFISELTQEIDTEIKPNAEFVIPIDIRVPFKKLLDNKNDLLGGLVNVLTQKKVKLKYEGIAAVNFAKVNLTIDINKEEELEINI